MAPPPPDFSYCVLWSPLWPITLLFPFIGHTGIADSRGIANDFQGSYYVGTDGHMAFGPATRYWKVPMDSDDDDDYGTADHDNDEDDDRARRKKEQWDEAIQEANRIYNGRMHNICCDNCHSHVCCALNQLHLKNQYGKWNMVKLCFVLFFQAKFVSVGAFLCQFLPFTILMVLIGIFGGGTTK